MSSTLIHRTILRSLARGATVVLVSSLMATTVRAQQSAGTQAAPSATADASVREPASWVGAGPRGATLRCRDGSFPVPRAPDSACDGKGGVAVRFPLKPVPGAGAPPPPPAVRAAPTSAATRSTVTTTTTTTTTAATAAAMAPSVSRPQAVRVPDDATLLCQDGTIVRADTVATRCGPHGGLRVRFPRRTAPR